LTRAPSRLSDPVNSNEDSPTEARAIGKDELTDVALLKIDSPRKFPASASRLVFTSSVQDNSNSELIFTLDAFHCTNVSV